MLSTSLFRSFCSPTRRTGRRVRRLQTSHCRLTLEALEIRALPSVTLIPLPPAPAGYPMVSSAAARLDGQGDAFGTGTYSNGGFPPQFKSEAFRWTPAAGTQLLIDPATQQPYSTFVDWGTDGSVLVRSNNPDPYTSYFDLLSPGPGVSLVPLPPAPAGYPVVSSAAARLDGQGEVFGTGTYSNGGFPPQFKSEAFHWTPAGGTQLLVDPATQQPYSTLVDLGTDGSVLVRSNNPDPYTSYFDLLSPGPAVSLVPLPPAPAGYPMVSSAAARLDGQGEVFGTGTYSNGGFPPQFKSEAFHWTADGGTQLLIDPASRLPYSTLVDVGTDGSVLVRSNNPDPYTSYFDLLSPGPDPQVSLVPLPPAPAGYPMVSSAAARLGGQGDVFGSGTYSNGGFPPQFKSEAFHWTADGGTQLLIDPAYQLPYSTIEDLGTDGSVLVRSNNPDPYTSYFDLLSPDPNVRAFIADPGALSIRAAGVSLPPDRCASGVVVGGPLTGYGQISELTHHDPQVNGPYLRHRDKAFQWKGDSVPQVLTNQTNYLLGAFYDATVEATVYLPAT